MKQWPVMAATVVLILVLSPFQGTDIGKLRPAQWVYLSRQEDTVALETDMGDRGEGADVISALEDLRRSAPGELFLETADYALISREALEDLVMERHLMIDGIYAIIL